MNRGLNDNHGGTEDTEEHGEKLNFALVPFVVEKTTKTIRALRGTKGFI